MKRVAAFFYFTLISVLFLGVTLVLPASSEAAKSSKTLQNLMTAFNGESNARAKYLAYAEKAEKESYGKVASLFRAAAKAEEIHLNNHARVIKAMGGAPKADIRLPEIKSTRENIQDAKKGEEYERNTMYPQFIAQAKQENDAEAIRTFTYASNAEAEHARLYGEAQNNLNQWKVQKAEFNVCPTCGFTVQSKPGFASCPTCATPSKLFQAVL